MANYYASSRTNYFLVKDVEAFTNEVESLSQLTIITKVIDEVTFVGLLSEDEDGGFPWSLIDDQGDTGEIEWGDLFAKHLQDDSVAILIEAGAEKLRYISGYAVAYNNKKETRVIDLSDIYKLAEEIGKDVPRAEY